jgi:signal transduction histidine kinase
VEAIGGTFELDSPRGRGTRVSAAIPAMALT